MNDGILAKLKNEKQRIVIHHVGGRDGSMPLKISPEFSSDFKIYIYDADETCLEQVQSIYTNFNVEVLPFCLDSNSEKKNFYLCYDPYASSLRKINPVYQSYYHRLANYDYIVGEITTVVESKEIETITLDELCHIGINNSVMPPDFLSIDAQGSSHDILSGATMCLESNILGVVCEVEFIELYIGEKGLGEISTLLKNNSLNFIRAIDIQEMKTYRVKSGIVGKGVDVGANILFLRDPTSIAKDDANAYAVKLCKLAFLALSFDCIEISIECLLLIGEDTFNQTALNLGSYGKFLHKFISLYKKIENVRPKTFIDYYPTFEISKQRFSTTNNLSFESSDVDLKNIIESNDLFEQLVEHLWSFGNLPLAIKIFTDNLLVDKGTRITSVKLISSVVTNMINAERVIVYGLDQSGMKMVAEFSSNNRQIIYCDDYKWGQAIKNSSKKVEDPLNIGLSIKDYVLINAGRGGMKVRRKLIKKGLADLEHFIDIAIIRECLNKNI